MPQDAQLSGSEIRREHFQQHFQGGMRLEAQAADPAVARVERRAVRHVRTSSKAHLVVLADSGAKLAVAARAGRSFNAAVLIQRRDCLAGHLPANPGAFFRQDDAHPGLERGEGCRHTAQAGANDGDVTF